MAAGEKTITTGTAVAIGIAGVLLGAGGAVAVMLLLENQDGASGTTTAKTFAPPANAAK